MGDHHDRQDIADVIVRYATGVDQRDWQQLRSVFIDDCHLDYGRFGSWQGADTFVEHSKEAQQGFGVSLHRMSNIAVVVTGDNATARSYVDALVMAVDGASGFNMIGHYDDTLVRTPEGWRIAERALVSHRLTAVGAS